MDSTAVWRQIVTSSSIRWQCSDVIGGHLIRKLKGFETIIVITQAILKLSSWDFLMTYNILILKLLMFLSTIRWGILFCHWDGQKSRKVFRYEWDMKINKHLIINVSVLQGKFDVIIKWCLAEVNQTYPTCAFIKCIFRVTFF